jgi:hypothetical protein
MLNQVMDLCGKQQVSNKTKRFPTLQNRYFVVGEDMVTENMADQIIEILMENKVHWRSQRNQQISIRENGKIDGSKYKQLIFK